MSLLLSGLSLLILLLGSSAHAQQADFFAVLADPQLGMFAHDANFTQEAANFQFVIANLNRLHPRFVVICGDLVNRTGDSAEIAAYKQILAGLDPSIPVYNVAGNHDVSNTPTPATLAAYRAAFGPDFYTFSSGDITGIVLDSNLIRTPQSAPDDARRQQEWLRKTLTQIAAQPNRRVLVFQHIPYFLKDRSETTGYFDIPQPQRSEYLDLLEKAGVRYVFAGHTHHSFIAQDGPLTEVVTGAVGMPLGGSLSGFRIVLIQKDQLTPEWFCLGGIPNQIDSQHPPATSCPQ
jgi:3',5'-cyclic AMP phosphodiesterase CpdA